MRRMPEFPQLPLSIQNGRYDRVEKKQMHRSFRENAQSQENGWHHPDEPGRLLLVIPVKPTDHGEAKERYVERFNLNEPPFFDHAEIHHPDQSGDERSSCTESRLSHDDKREGHGEDRESRGQTRRPFVTMSGYTKGRGHEPIHQRRFAEIRFSTNLRH